MAGGVDRRRPEKLELGLSGGDNTEGGNRRARLCSQFQIVTDNLQARDNSLTKLIASFRSIFFTAQTDR